MLPPTALSHWESFYVIVGSSAAALTGLQFVVIALVAESRVKGSPETIDAFATPTVVHFCSALGFSALLSAPWDGLEAPAVLLVFIGLCGIIYTAIVIRRTRQQKGYTPVFEDWLFHAILPFLAYAMGVAAGVLLFSDVSPALFTIALATLLLVFIGIHNAWDTVTFITVNRLNEDEPEVSKPMSQASSPQTSQEVAP